jgi:hypothetical protein
MLTADMAEKASGRIELKHMKRATGEDMLHYLYNRQLPLKPSDTDRLRALLEAADQYDLPELGAWCAAGLAASVREDNYLELMRLAEMHTSNSRQLKLAVLKFIENKLTTT